jgi:hypothetical protein
VSTTLHSTLESSVRAMNEALARLSSQVAVTDSSTDLWEIIHRPGWTTPAEAALVKAMAVSITEHAESLTHAHQALIEGALAVAESPSE